MASTCLNWIAFLASHLTQKILTSHSPDASAGSDTAQASWQHLYLEQSHPFPFVRMLSMQPLAHQQLHHHSLFPHRFEAPAGRSVLLDEALCYTAAMQPPFVLNGDLVVTDMIVIRACPIPSLPAHKLCDQAQLWRIPANTEGHDDMLRE